jgi:hypothetical protein
MFAAQKIGNRKFYWLLLTGLSLTFGAVAQGTFIYDQQSANETAGGGGAVAIQANEPIGQSFAPALSSVGFIRLFLSDNAFDSVGATVYVNLRTNSITGPILSSTDPVFMPDRFSGYTNFIFVTPVAVVPGVTYFFQPVVQSGDSWSVVAYNSYNYQGGNAFEQGLSLPSIDLWFREGIVVPEPSSLSLLIGSGVLFYVRRAKNRK